MWNFFRLENEHLNNCGEFRAVRDISVAPLNADDLTLLDQMMDQEDGVRNRRKNKQWKRSLSVSLRRPRLASQYVQPLPCPRALPRSCWWCLLGAYGLGVLPRESCKGAAQRFQSDTKGGRVQLVNERSSLCQGINPSFRRLGFW